MEATGMDRSLAFTALLEVPAFRDMGWRQAEDLVTLFLEDYRSVVRERGVKVGETDMVTWARKWMEGNQIRLETAGVPARYVPTKTTISRGQVPMEDPYKWYVRFIREGQVNVEAMTQGELLTLWQQIGVLFNLEGMRDSYGTQAEIDQFLRPK